MLSGKERAELLLDTDQPTPGIHPPFLPAGNPWRWPGRGALFLTRSTS